jgi:5-methylcytosine-specific restriction endonuclease McrBC GTP-binding regulatory subunit McrB
MTVDLAKHYHKDTSCIIRIKKHLADLGLQQTSNSFVYTIKANICHIREQTQLPDEAKRNLIQQLTSFGLGVLDCTESMQAEQEELLEYYKQIKPELDRAYKLIYQGVRGSRGGCVASSFQGPISTPYSPR